MYIPTKQEIKFEDEKIIYAFVQAAVKHALAQFSVTPTLDFDLDASIQQLSSIQQPFTEKRQDAATSASIFKGFTQKHQAHFIEKSDRSELKHWKDFYESPEKGERSQGTRNKKNNRKSVNDSPFNISAMTELTQLLNTYIIAPSSNGFLLIHQQAAHERVLYEQLKAPVKTNRWQRNGVCFPQPGINTSRCSYHGGNNPMTCNYSVT